MKMIKNLAGIILTIVLFFNLNLNAATTLGVGDVVILAFNGDGNDGLSFMPLVNLESGTEIFITDIGWSDQNTSFLNYTGISDKILKYTAPSAIAAGTIIRCDVNNQANFLCVLTMNGVTTPYFDNIATLNSAEEILVFQGTVASPIFKFAVTDVYTGWAVNVPLSGTDGGGHGSALPPGLTDDVTAMSLATGTVSVDNWAYTGSIEAATAAVWKTRIGNPTNWTGDDVNPTIPAGPYTVTGIVLGIPQNFAVAVNGTNLGLSWDAVTDATSYKVMASEDPYGTFSDISSSGTFAGTSWSYNFSAAKMFYYVVAAAQ